MSPTSPTPMMRQYQQIKSQYPDALLLFRMGDFYELFGEDAVRAARELEITLTSRDKGECKTPMAGVPFHALEGYLVRLVRNGHKVVICDQLENPRDARGLVKRGVTRVVTPSTLTQADVLDPRQNNYLCACASVDEHRLVAVLWDISTADVLVMDIDRRELASELGLFPIAEYIAVDEGLLGHAELVEPEQALLAEFAAEPPAEARALAAAAQYLSDTQFRCVRPARIERRKPQAQMHLDETSVRNLELLENLSGGRANTLIGVIDRSCTAMGGRLLRRWMLAPLMDIAEIEQRLDSLDYLIEHLWVNEALRQKLRQIQDVERIVNRVSLDQHRPRDLVMLGRSLEYLHLIRTEFNEVPRELLIGELIGTLPDLCELGDLLLRALVDEPPALARQGNLIREGFDERLDALRAVRADARDAILRMEAAEKQRTGISTLKIRHNRVFGYYIEVSRAMSDRVPETYIRKQTLVNAERFVTPEIKDLEQRILEADEQLQPCEEALYAELCQNVREREAQMLQAARQIARIDLLCGFAELSASRDYCRPQLCKEPLLDIQDLRHPVIETLSTEPFISNPVELDAEGDRQLMILTGPNMAGKSTYMRQVALAVLMAQLGCHVPARSARIGICDRIFTRVGASDNLAEGKSTFMVEMSETAAILRHATRQSLIVIDEVGRGTSTFDGISIAWAVAEYLSSRGQIAARTLFATHFHELTELAQEIPGVWNAHIRIREQSGRLVFLRRVAEGAAPKSYGIEVARLAQLPETVIGRARELLTNLEAREYRDDGSPSIAGPQQAPLLFAQASAEQHPALERLQQIDPDQCTPRQALELLYELCELNQGMPEA